MIAGELRHVRGSDVVAARGWGARARSAARAAASVPVLARYQRAAARRGRVRRRAVHRRRPRPGSAQRHRQLCRGAVDATARCRGCRPGGCDRRGWWQCARADRARRVHAGRRDHAAASGSGTSPPSCPPPAEERAGRAAGRIRVNATSALERLERIIDTAGVAARIEAALAGRRPPPPAEGRARCWSGMLLVAVDGRPALLRGVHKALTGLPDTHEQRRLGVIAQWQTGPHLLTYRQARVHLRPAHHGACQGQARRHPVRAALTRSSTSCWRRASPCSASPTAAATPSTGPTIETWSRPPPKPPPRPHPSRPPSSPPAATERRRQRRATATSDSQTATMTPAADREAAWGHRNTNHPARNELFFGYYLQAVTSVRDEHGPEVPELARRMHLASCDHDPPARSCPCIAAHAHHAPSRSAICSPTPATPTASRATWALPLRRSGHRPRPGPAPQRPRPPRHPHGRDLRKREPLLPRHTHHAARTRTPPARRHRRADHSRTTPLRPSSPATSSHRSPATTKTATAA